MKEAISADKQIARYFIRIGFLWLLVDAFLNPGTPGAVRTSFAKG